MTQAGLWDQVKLFEVKANPGNGVIDPEPELVGDITHYHAHSGFETVHYSDEKGKAQKKSQSKLTKTCRCQNRRDCEHPWVLRDEGAGTIVKSSRKMIWGL